MTDSDETTKRNGKAKGEGRRIGRKAGERKEVPAADDAVSQPADSGGNPFRSKAELVSVVIEEIEQRLAKGELKPTVGDFIRLVQLEKELQEEQPREIKVTWVEPAEADFASAK